MTTPYTYIVNCPDGRRYYGVRFAKGCHPSDLWITYFTSSRHIKKMILEHGKEAFSVQIRKTFSVKDSAMNWEQRVLARLKVKKNPNWVNITAARSWRSMEGDANPSKRQDVKDKISKANKGRARPDQAERMRKNHPLNDPDVKARMIETRRQKFVSGEIEVWNKGKNRPEISGEKHPRFGKTFKPLADFNRREYTCPHCGKLGKGPSMKRYHFEKCKINPSRAS